MSTLRALIVDGERGFADRLRGWLSDYDLEVVVAGEWNDALGTTVDPNIVFIAIEPGEETGLVSCERARAAWPGARIVLAAGAPPLDDLHGAHGCLDKRTLTPQELHATLDALIGPLLGLEPEAGHKPEGGATGRVAELEEEVERLRWELDETRRAAKSAPYSRDFMRMSAVVGSKEKEIVRLKKEISARDHKIATAQRTQREASARSVVATREREAATGHAAQMQRDLEAELAEVRRLRLEVQRQAAEAEQALASLIDERQQHDESRRQHEIVLAAHAEALKQAKEDQLRTRTALETQLREEKDQAVAAVSAAWKGKHKRLRRRRARSLSILHDRVGELQAAHDQELAAARAEAEGRREEELEAARTAAERGREELQRLHELSLAEALAAHADAESRAEQHRSARNAAEARLHEEKARAVAATVAEWQSKLDTLRSAHAESVAALRQHFLDQLEGPQASRKQELAKRDEENEALLRRSAEELVAARTQAAQLDVETRQRHEEELLQAQDRHLQALTALAARLRGEKDAALSANSSEWEGRLEQLGRAHADSVGALRQQHLEQLAGLQASAAQELARREGEHDASLSGIQATHLAALTALESRLRGEREEGIAATVSAWDEKLEELRRQHQASLDALRREHQGEIVSLQASHEQSATERHAAHQAALERATRLRAELVELHALALSKDQASRVEAERRADLEHRSAREAIEDRLREEQARAVAAAAADWESRLDELRRGQAGSLEALRQQFQDQIAEQRVSAADELGQREEELRAAFRRAAEDLASARTQAAQLDQETRQQYEQELVRAETRHLEALGDLEGRQRQERDRAVAAAVAAWEGKLEELRAAHAASVDTLRRKHQDQLTALRAAREQELSQEDDEHEAALRRLGEELAAARSKAAQAGPAQLLARHAEAIKAQETRLLEEKEKAVGAVVAEWKAKMERLRRGHADAMAALRREHEDQLLALDAARQEGLATRQGSDAASKVVPLKAVNRDRSG